METRKVTLRDVFVAVADVARDDDEAVATLAHLVNSRRLRFEGVLAGATVRLGAPRPKPRAAAAHA